MLYRPKITYLLDDIGGIFNISNYTKNYLAYKYKLRKKDLLQLDELVEKYMLKYNNNDIIDRGLNKKVAYILYRNNIQTTRELQEAQRYNYLFYIRGLTKNMKKDIIYLLENKWLYI